MRIFLLCLLVIAGGLNTQLYSQDPILELYQVRVSLGHGTVAIVKDRTREERVFVERLIVLKVKVTGNGGTFNAPYTVELEKEIYNLNRQLGVSYNGGDISYSPTTFTSGLPGNRIKTKRSNLAGATPSPTTGATRTYTVAVLRDLTTGEETMLKDAVKNSVNTSGSASVYQKIITPVERHAKYIARKESTDAQVDNNIRNRLRFYITEGATGLTAEDVADLFPQKKVYKAIVIDGGNRSDDGLLLQGIIFNKAATKYNAAFITHGDKDHWYGIGAHNSSGLSAALVNLEIGNGSDPSGAKRKVPLYYPGTPGEPTNEFKNDNYPTSFFTYLRTQVASSPYYSYEIWEPDTDYTLYEDGTNLVRLETIMTNCILRESWITGGYSDYSGGIDRDMLGCNSLSAVGKNNKSAVCKITWTKGGQTFDFLIQGDLESAHSSGNIAYTKQHFLQKMWTGAGFQGSLINRWDDNNGVDQDAQTIVIDPTVTNITPFAVGGTDIGRRFPAGTADNGAYRRRGLERIAAINDGAESVNFGTTGRRTLADGTVVIPDDANYNQAVSYPDRGRQRMFNTMGKVCLALIPHHGARTSNLWFESRNVIFGSSKGGAHGHPQRAGIQAVEYNVGADRYFFTYTDRMEATKTIIQADLNNMRAATNSVNTVYTLKDHPATENDDNRYWVFRVDNLDLTQFTVHNGNTNADEDAGTQVIPAGSNTFSCN